MTKEQTKEVLLPIIYHNSADGQWHWAVNDENGYPVATGHCGFQTQEQCKAHLLAIRDAINTGIERGRMQ